MIKYNSNTLNKKTIVIIGAGKHQISSIKKAKLMGYKTLAVDINPKAKGFDFADDVIIESAHNPIAILEK